MDPKYGRFLLWSCLFVIIKVLSGCASSAPQTAVFPPPTVTPASALLAAGESFQFTSVGNAAIAANPTWMVNGVPGGSTSTGTITSTGLYTAPSSPSAGAAVTVSVANTGIGLTSTNSTVTFFDPNHPAPGSVTASNNPQVAQYNYNAPNGSSVQVQFGTTTSYGLTTWAQPAPAGGGSVIVLVAGMRASTTYHMQAIVKLASGQQILDNDQTFTTGALDASLIPSMVIQQPNPSGIAPGVELLNLFAQPQGQLVALAVDMSGNVIWYYPMNPGELPFPIKLLPNGHMLVVVVEGLTSASAPPTTSTFSDEVREIDLAGNVIYRLSLNDIDTGLAAINALQPLANLHHDIQKLPNGHYMILANFVKTITAVPGFSQVIGDGLIDWDPVKQAPVWTWSTFDHIPLTHDPWGPTDWTHANAVLYSPDDGNLILSMRDQNWVVKINYQDGAGDGSILWHLGDGGDFTMTSGTAPLEWNYAQHYPTVLTPNSAGIFQLMVFNNGGNRLLDTNNDVCGTPGFAACFSSVPIFELNETTKTAQVLSDINLSPHYSLCCGNASILANGDLEYDVAYDVNTPGQSFVQEVTPEATPQLVWQLNIANQLAYRAFRITSLYPGVEWTQDQIAAANVPAVAKTAAQKSAGQH